jgi:hypothetical protein
MAIGIVLLIAGSAFSQMSIDGQYNIADLMQTAQNSFDLDNQDAVFLLDKKRIDWLPDGRMVERIHRIIWIGTNYAVDIYGDHRIPYDSERCNFNVSTVRTWRDGTWWVTGETGIVETLPRELRTAYDYTNIREMMLLHNGIEIPCILEIAYEVEDKEPFRENIEGHWNLKRMEPCVKSTLTLGIPKDKDFQYSKHVDVPNLVNGEDGILDLFTWEMGTQDAMPYPRTEELKMLEPFVNWSTWINWKYYGAYLDSLYKSHMELDSALMAVADSIEDAALTPQSRINAVIEYINKKTRLIDYPIDFWLYTPRDATRVFSTGYCHPLDRVILTAALLDPLADNQRLMFLCKNHVFDLDPEELKPKYKASIGPPTVMGLYDVAMEVWGFHSKIYYEPESGRIYSDRDILRERYYWRPGFDDERAWMTAADFFPRSALYFVKLELRYDKEAGNFTGNGVITAGKPYVPFGDVLGLNNEMHDYLSDLITGIFENAEITTYNPEIIKETYVSLRFEFSVPKPDVDSYGRIKLKLGEPPDGIFGMLPEDIELYHSERSSKIFLPANAAQLIKIRLDLDGLEAIYYPEEIFLGDRGDDIYNHFTINSKIDENYLTISRTIMLGRTHFSFSKDWPGMRQLLLAETHDRNQTIYLKIKEDEE